MGKLDKDDAYAIAKKLGASISESNGAHDEADVYHDGKLIASFGIRRGSRKGQGHDHICDELNISRRRCKNLAQCVMSREEWIEEMKQNGYLD